ncbi:MAG: helix-turn-helix domain-containing protein [Bdellovibrionaceae bacterium]|nr:helix-turn-helix domain-containing protein [Pseudobdellovibrionaceae bacterium]
MDHLLVGKLYLKLLDFGKAQATAEEGLALAEKTGDLQKWIPLALFCARLFKETDQSLKLNDLILQLKEYETDRHARSGLNYLLGTILAEKGDLDEADRCFEIAEVSALTKADELNASYGRCMIFRLKAEWSKALSMLNELESRLAEQHEPEVEMAVQITKARLLWELKDREGSALALEKVRALAKVSQSLYAQVQALITEAFISVDQGDFSQARQQWTMIERLLPTQNGPLLRTRLERLKQHLQLAEKVPTLNLVSDEAQSVLSYDDVRIDLTKLPQLKSLLVYLASESGRVYSKEEICQFVWGESYHPLRHDNKIYVTIRRLRALFNEMDIPKVILNRHDGYLFNPQIRFHQIDGARQSLAVKDKTRSSVGRAPSPEAL